MRAFRQMLAAGICYGYLATTPAVAAGANPTPPPRAGRAYARFHEHVKRKASLRNVPPTSGSRQVVRQQLLSRVPGRVSAAALTTCHRYNVDKRRRAWVRRADLEDSY